VLTHPLAALAIYQCTRNLAVLNNTNELAQYLSLAEQQLKVLIVLNALALLNQKDTWITLPIAPEGLGQDSSQSRSIVSLQGISLKTDLPVGSVIWK